MRFQDFLASRPILYGVPTAAVLGAVLALSLRVGDQTAPYEGEMSASPILPVAEAEPIAWPGGKVPDYVIGTDFLPRPGRWDTPVEVAVASPPAEYQPIVWRSEPEAAPSPAAVAQTRWPSGQGDILNVSLPEDAPTGEASAAVTMVPAPPAAL